MSQILEQAKELKAELTDFVLDAEGELAQALESFSAAQLSRSQQTDMHRRELVIDRFLIEGKVDSQTPIGLFIAEQTQLKPADKQVLQGWQRAFVGLFAVDQVLEDGLQLMNWTTAKLYPVKLTQAELEAVAKLKPGDILLTQIAPISDTDWMFFSKWMGMGRLGKPKLAVAIGNFKQNYKDHLYSDAPDLLEEAWKSVETYHQQFVDFFGSSEVTMPGYQLGKKLTEFQEIATEKQFEAAGIDRSKSLQEIAEEAGISEAEIAEAAEAMGGDAKMVEKVLAAKQSPKMMAPKVELPPHLKKAEQVTVLMHPRWGQVFLSNYMQLKSLLADATKQAEAGPIVRKYLEDPAIPAFVLYQLTEAAPEQLEAVLKDVLQQPDFQLKTDLKPALQTQGKPVEPELPEIASVPIHLHNLFQAAVLEISKDKTKKKTKPKTGFQR